MTDESLIAIAKQYGSPTYVFDTKALRARMHAIGEIFGPKVKLCYSIKANSFLIPAALQEVANLEVCSPGELEICERLQVPMDRVIYSGVNKEPWDVERAVIHDEVGICTAESLRHVRLLEAAGAKSGKVVPVLLRLNSGAQFGMSREDLLSVIRERESYPHLELAGIHYFAGTQRKNKNLHQQKDELEMLRQLFNEVREQEGFVLRKLEYGPGLPVPLFADGNYSDTLAPARELAETLRSVTEWAELTVEAGRFYAAECGYYITKVVDSKSVDDKNFCIVDGGIHHVNYLGQIMGMKEPVIRHYRGNGDPDAASEMVEYKRIADNAADVLSMQGAEENEYSQDAAAKAAALSENAEEDCAEKEYDLQDWAICGSLCTTNDDLVRSRRMTGPQLGDLLVFENIGAYSVTEGIYLFLSRKMPRIVLYNDSSDVQLVRDFTETNPLNTPQL